MSHRLALNLCGSVNNMFADTKTAVAAPVGRVRRQWQAQCGADPCLLSTANSRAKQPVLVGTYLVLTGGPTPVVGRVAIA